MKRKIAIVTKIDLNNYGNRLQNYALQEFLRNEFPNYEVITLNNMYSLNKSKNSIDNILRRIKLCLMRIIKNKSSKRKYNFNIFNKKINISKRIYDDYHTYKRDRLDFVILGSDQIWNYNFDMPDIYFGKGLNCKRVISYAASFGISILPTEKEKYYNERLMYVNSISVREIEGANIIKKITDRESEVLIDPTLLLTSERWELECAKPEKMCKKKYILTYFLGSISSKTQKAINDCAAENDCEVINVLDCNSSFYNSGPSEFLYLEKNAFLICTDSFHSCVFSLIFNRPFVVFEREGENGNKMNSRIDTFLSKFELTDRRFDGEKITSNNLKHDYNHAYSVLKKEREKSLDFLKHNINNN